MLRDAALGCRRARSNLHDTGDPAGIELLTCAGRLHVRVEIRRARAACIRERLGVTLRRHRARPFQICDLENKRRFTLEAGNVLRLRRFVARRKNPAGSHDRLLHRRRAKKIGTLLAAAMAPRGRVAKSPT
jgi:hypothetical protein